MNNKELTGELARRLGYTNKDAAQLVASMVAIMGEELQEGKTLTFQGFGTFEVKKKLERIVVNPATRQRLLVPPKLVLSYKPDNSLKEKFKKMQANE
ncbi:HU family DNA-binding protein [Phocaeicola faecicola]|jgi:DNA-binding protein HU-beta|uniref:HU family DNA-binding protein n=1 Tax=Phocaeicola faecicola TaxID=2739389 RepID=UPI0015E65E70|nr:HU family DNA-binding protein [Phocaeicola faecicola]MCI5742617.1 HU family DNA-binding protein [Bacteroides sp.]MDD6909530.1 HU family DNA-binding protein [Bacteroidaceae bacterium]MDY4873176.1 HU family DNA-binding protein [Phocaeicola faecicola]